MNNNKSLFISIEGGEGVGKSSFVEALSKHLSKHCISHITTREPGGSPIAEKLRDIFNSPPEGERITTLTEFLLLSAARKQHLDFKIKPALDRKQWVLCDRFIDSSYVYQGMLGGLDLDFISSVTAKCIGDLKIDLTFLLDCDISLSNERLSNRNNTSYSKNIAQRYDNAEDGKKEKLRTYFLEMAINNPLRFKTLDSRLPLEELVKQAEKAIRDIL